MSAERRFSFEEFEKAFYCSQFGDSLDAQTERHIKSRHKDRIRTMDQIREDPKTCPEETVYQLGTKDGHEDPALFAQVVAELVEEFSKRFGSHVQVLDWALHMDEATPHIHIYKDLRTLEKAVGNGDEQNSNLDLFSLEMFENIAYVMAKHADPNIPDTPEEWLDEFNTLSIYQVLPSIIELWGLNVQTEVESKKNFVQLTDR